MYCEFFKLRCLPFEDRADARFFFATGDREEALAAMEYESHYGEGLALVLGEAGMGKTLLIRTLLPKLTTPDRVVVLTWTSNAERNLIRETAKGFGLSIPTKDQDTRALSRIQRSLLRYAKAGHRSILLIDQAEHLTTENLSELQTLSQLKRVNQKLLNIILVGKPQVREHLDKPINSTLAQQLYGGRTLLPLTRQATVAYIEHRLRIAGAADPTIIFDPSAIDLVLERSGGVPRLINRICNTSMVLAYGAGLKRINRKIIGEATQQVEQDSHIPDIRELARKTVSIDVVKPGKAHRTLHPTSCGVVEDHPSHESTTRTHRSESIQSEILSNPQQSQTRETNTMALDPIESLKSSADHYVADVEGIDLSNNLSDLEFHDILGDGDVSQSQLDQSIAQAVNTKSSLDSSLERCATIDRNLSGLTISAERIMGNLTDLDRKSCQSMDRQEARAAELLKKTESITQMLDAQIHKGQTFSTNLADYFERIKRERNETNRIESKLKNYAESLADRAEEVQHHSARLMETVTAGDRLCTKLSGMIDSAPGVNLEAQRTIEELRSLVLAAQSESQTWQEKVRSDTVKVCRKDLDAFMKEAMDQFSTELEKRLGGHHDSAKSLIGRLAHETSRIENVLTDEKHKCQQFIDDYRQRFDAEQQRQAEMQPKLLNTMDQMRVNRDELQTSLQGLTHQFEQAEHRIDQIQNKINNSMEDMGQKEDSMHVLVKNLTDQSDRGATILQSILANILIWEDRQSTTVSAIEQFQQINQQKKEIQEAITQGLNISQELTARHADGQIMQSVLASSVENAQSIVSDLQITTTEAANKVGQLDSHHASLSNLLRRLLESTGKGNAAADRLDEMQNQVETLVSDSQTHVEQQTREVWDLTTRTEAHLKQLTHQNNETSKLLEAVNQATDPSNNIVKELAMQVDDAKTVIDTLSQRSQEGKTLATQITTLSQLVEEVKQLDSNLRNQTEQATKINKEVDEATRSAHQQTITLQEMSATTQGMVETYQQMKLDTSLVTEEFLIQIDLARDTLNSSSEFTEWFRSESVNVDDKLRELKEQVNRLDQAMIKATKHPAKIIFEAKAQSQQLEKVCSAVQKIFQGLSQAALNAKAQTDTCNDSADQANQCLAQLTQETQQATRTMHEWVQEAIRIQNRLETVIGQAPTIGQTHPAGKIQRLAETATPLTSRFTTNKTANRGELEVLSVPKLTKTDEPKVAVTPSPTTNRISQLIEEARTVVESSTGTVNS